MIDDRARLKNKINALKDINDRRVKQAEYRQLDKNIKRSIREDKKNYTEGMVREAENAAASHNMRELFDITKKIAGLHTRSTAPVKDKDGNLLTRVDQQLERWREHFISVLNVEREGVYVTRNCNINMMSIPTEPPTRSEIIDPIK